MLAKPDYFTSFAKFAKITMLKGLSPKPNDWRYLPVLEVSLFVNPLGTRCFNCEQDLLRADHQLPDLDLTFNFIPLVNMHTIEQTLRLYNVAPTLANRQRVSATLYQVTLDYKAALFQGRKRGRQFLLGLQKALIDEGQNYSADLAYQVAKDNGLDLAMFMEDRQGELSQQAFKDDQRIANELGVAESTTAVIYDSNHPDYDTLVHDFDYATFLEAVSPTKFNHSHQRFFRRTRQGHPNFRTY